MNVSLKLQKEIEEGKAKAVDAVKKIEEQNQNLIREVEKLKKTLADSEQRLQQQVINQSINQNP